MTDLIANGDYKMVTTRVNYFGNWYFTALNESVDPHFVNLRQALAKHPIIITDTISEAIGYLRQGGYIFPSQEDLFLLPIIQAECNFYYFKEDTPQQDVYFIFPNGSLLHENFDRAIIMNYGYIEYAWGKYFENGLIGPPYPNCSVGNNLSNDYKPIDIMSSFGIFLIIMICLAISSVGFFVEFNLYWDPKQARRLNFVAKKIFQSTKIIIEYKKYSNERSEERDLRNSVA
uniref:Uncharacterized protein n=2 Tax=Acrobeloides nanus TaxID=290746 RepID=A0A914E220_9BILA